METVQVHIVKEMLIGEVMARWPHTTTIMARHGFKVGGCNLSPLETIEQISKTQGMSDSRIDEMIGDVNKSLAEEKPAESMSGVVNITETAALHIKKIMQSEGKENAFLKLSVVPGGCSGFNYEMDFVEKPSSQDMQDESQGVKLLMEKTHEKFLQGITIDFRETLNGAGFVMQNPNAKSGCSCGQSFSV
ncbi:MAG: iron-sulfur cluster assembly accessory protein [Candidatus Aenigmarchaeota archaeon]|nr:iron-sulfur cluster assembly accessory protein [Candidatus Aenigmarchaeota archaeon]